MFRTFPLLLLLLLVSCSSLTRNRENYLHSYQQGEVRAAQKTLAKSIKKEMPERRYRESPNAVWLLLDQATLLLAQGDAEGAIRNYDAALDAIDFYRQDLLVEEAGKVALSDGIAAYAGEDYEQLLAPLYFALALLQKGDEANAESLLRRVENVEQYPNNAFAKYLFATLLEKRKDYSNALILYRQADALVGSAVANASIERIERKMSGRAHPSATILFICHNGLAPYKITEYSNASVASAAAVETLLQTTHNIKPAMSSLTGLPLPKLVSWPHSKPTAIFATVDDAAHALIPMYDIASTARQQLKKRMPLIAARAAARMLLRRGFVYGANEKDPSLGFATDLAMLLANASTKADTRSWGTLPSSIDAFRIDVAPGEHTIAFSKGTETLGAPCTMQLSDGDLCVVQLFYIYPHVANVIVNKKGVTL